MHPHDSDSLLRIAIVEPNLGKDYIKQILKTTMTQILENIQQIKGLFDGSRVRASATQRKPSAADGGP
jgi:hypothetical protein